MPEAPGWDETRTSFRYRVKDPGDFEEGSFRTIALGNSGVKAVIGRLKGESATTIQSLIFPEDKFTEDEAKQWVKDHSEAAQKAEWTREGRILKADAKRRYTLGVVYEPDVVDSQGDFAEADEIEKACWDFMRRLQGKSRVTKLALELLESVVNALQDGVSVTLEVTECWDDLEKAAGGLGYMHRACGEEIGDIVECYCAPTDFQVNGEWVRKGTWLLGVVWSPEYWQKVEGGEITGFSMGGRGKRIAVVEKAEDLAGAQEPWIYLIHHLHHEPAKGHKVKSEAHHCPLWDENGAQYDVDDYRVGDQLYHVVLGEDVPEHLVDHLGNRYVVEARQFGEKQAFVLVGLEPGQEVKWSDADDAA